MKILFLVPYPLYKAPSQRFRVEAYLNLLDQEAIDYDIKPFLDDESWKVLYKGGSGLKKALAVLKGYWSRLKLLAHIKKYDFVFVHREAAPLGPPVFEWAAAKLLGRKLIFDFDDAIWIPNISESNRIALKLKWFGKVGSIARYAYKISAGNDYLKNWSLQHNSNVLVNPTCVDMVARYNRQKIQEDLPLTIGWTGSHSTLKYLDSMVPVIKKLEKKIDFRFLVICDKKPELDLASLVYIPWTEKTEIDDLLQMHIGIMPLDPDPWSEGKCGFKLIQYLSLGIPAVASPVGVNSKIVDHNSNGYLCSNEEEWYNALEILLTDPEKRKSFGNAGRQKMLEQYSVQSNSSNFLNLFN